MQFQNVIFISLITKIIVLMSIAGEKCLSKIYFNKTTLGIVLALYMEMLMYLVQSKYGPATANRYTDELL